MSVGLFLFIMSRLVFASLLASMFGLLVRFSVRQTLYASVVNNALGLLARALKYASIASLYSSLVHLLLVSLGRFTVGAF